MSETEGAPQGAPEDQAAPVAQAPEQPPQEAQNEPQAPAETKPEPDVNPKTPEWVKRRINELTAEKHAERRRAEELEERLRLMEAVSREASGQSGQDQPKPEHTGQQRHGPLSQADIDKLVQQRAVELKEQESFNAACNGTYQAGKKSYEDFDDAVQHLSMLSGGAPKREFLEAVTALPNSHEVYYHLGRNLDEAARILSLPPVKMAVELARLSTSAAPKPKAASRAPAPIAPVSGASRGSDEDSDDLAKMPWDKFCKLREEQEKAYRGRR